MRAVPFTIFAQLLKNKKPFSLIRFVTEQRRIEEDVKNEKVSTLSLEIEFNLKRRKRLENLRMENKSTNQIDENL